MTKPAVWVQFIIKKNNGGENNLLHLKYSTCRKLWLFLFCNYKDLRSQIVLSYPYPQLRLIRLFWIPFKLWKKYGSWFGWLPIRKKGGRIDFGSQISLTLSLHQFLSNRGRPEIFYNVKYSNEGLESRI